MPELKPVERFRRRAVTLGLRLGKVGGAYDKLAPEEAEWLLGYMAAYNLSFVEALGEVAHHAIGEFIAYGVAPRDL